MAVFIDNVEETCKKHITANVMQSLDEAYKYNHALTQQVQAD